MIKLHLHVKQHPHVNRRRKRQRPVQLRNLRTNRTVELWYKAELLKLVRQIRGQTEAVILPMLKDLASQYTKDGYHSDFEDAFDRVSNLFGGLRQTAQRLAELAAQRSADQVDASLKAALQKSVSVDITSALSSSPIAAPMERAVVANIELIKSIPTKYLEKVKSEVYSGASQGMRWESIAEKIQAAGETTESRAKLIARDQVSKMNGAFNEARQKSLGLEKYIWQTSGDERVRDEHAQNDGKIFSWDDPPDTGHPGEDIQCRCVALPYFDLDAEEEKLSETPNEPSEEKDWMKGTENLDSELTGRSLDTLTAEYGWDDAMNIRGYTIKDFQKVNTALRDDKTKSVYVKRMDAAFEKAPKLDNDSLLYRGVRAFLDNLDDLQPGAVIQDKGFMSTSTRLDIAKEFGAVLRNGTAKNPEKYESAVLRIRASAGTKAIKLGNSSVVSGEQEVLLNRGGKLKVLGRTTEKVLIRGVESPIHYIDAELL